jgi:hypothetical protein
MGIIRINNNDYINKYREIKTAEKMPNSSINQYVSRTNQFITYAEKDLTEITITDLEKWLYNGNESKKNFVTSFLKTMLKYNVNDIQLKLDRNVLIFLTIN